LETIKRNLETKPETNPYKNDLLSVTILPKKARIFTAIRVRKQDILPTFKQKNN